VLRIQKRQIKATPGDYSLTILPLASAKLNLLIDTAVTDQDAVVTQHIKSAVQHIEAGLDFSIDTSGLIHQYYDGFSTYLPIWHRYIKTTDLVVEYWDGSAWAVASSSLYRIDISNIPPRVTLKDDQDWPTPEESDNNVRVGFKMDTSHSFLEDVRGGVIAWVADRYWNREGNVNKNVQAVIDRHKLHS
jgi:hypothetical protein